MTAMCRRGLTSIAIVSLLALLPASALADGGAGDNQYQDPLVAPIKPKKKQKTASSAPAASAPAATSAPASAAPAASNVSTTASGSDQLPRTGMPAGIVGLAGAAMVAAGLGLRRRAAPE
jgi:hypothetical protein